MLSILLLLLPVADEGDKTTSLRYLRPAKDGWVLESEIQIKKSPQGVVYRSRTERGQTRMTLEVHYDPRGVVTTGVAALAEGDKKSKVEVKVADNVAELKTGARTETHKLAGNPIVTTAPDWSDIFELVRRYDAGKKGKQEFVGLWIHPDKKTLNLAFTIERLGVDKIMAAGKPVLLDRYRIRLRSGGYLAWANGDRRVYKLMSDRKGAAGVVLDGMVEATRNLGP